MQRKIDCVYFGTVFFPRVIDDCKIKKYERRRFEIELKDSAKLYSGRNRIEIEDPLSIVLDYTS